MARSIIRRHTPYGPYPYPLEMRFGVRSVTKSVFAPLALLATRAALRALGADAQGGGLRAGATDPKWKRVRLIDAANMATGFGGTGSTKTHPNEDFDGYLGGDYDAWYTAPSFAEKIKQINADSAALSVGARNGRCATATRTTFCWAPRSRVSQVRSRTAGGLVRFRARARCLSRSGFTRCPTVRTREAGGRDGLVWCNAGYYPTLDDLAKIALLYQSRGAHGGRADSESGAD